MSELEKAILEVYREVGYVHKEGKVEFGNTKYKFASESSFIKAIRPAMINHKLTVRPKEYTIISSERSGKNILVTISAIYTLAHESGAFIEISALGQGMDTGDKAIPKALTGAYKYALRQTFMIETGDDPDNTASGIFELMDRLSIAVSECKTIADLDKLKSKSDKKIKSIKTSNYAEYSQMTAMITNRYYELKEDRVCAEIAHTTQHDNKDTQVAKGSLTISNKIEEAFQRCLNSDEMKSFDSSIKFLSESKKNTWVCGNLNKDQKSTIYNKVIDIIPQPCTIAHVRNVLALALTQVDFDIIYNIINSKSLVNDDKKTEFENDSKEYRLTLHTK